MIRKLLIRVLLLSVIGVLFWGSVSTASAIGETIQITSVIAPGCNSGQFRMMLQIDNGDGGVYLIHTRVTIGGLVYMNEGVNYSITGTFTQNWGLYNNFLYGPVPNPGTMPMPVGQQVLVEFFLERPQGTVLATWQLIVDSCDTGNILYNGLPRLGCSLDVPAGSVVGEAPLGAQVYYAPGQISPGLILNPGTYIVIGQDESETYYQIVLACQTLWVRKDTMQPSYQPPQNGAPLPTGIVG